MNGSDEKLVKGEQEEVNDPILLSSALASVRQKDDKYLLINQQAPENCYWLIKFKST